MRMSTETTTNATEVHDELCPQCYGRMWVSLSGRGVVCTCVTRKALDDATVSTRERARARRREDRAAGR
jgi:uncharacterized OB-fold protein